MPAWAGGGTHAAPVGRFLGRPVSLQPAAVEALRTRSPRDHANNHANVDRTAGRKGRRDALVGLWKASSLKRVAYCRRFLARNADAVVVGRTADGRATTHGVQTCGSVWSCPVCSARILAGRGEDLTRALDRHHRAGGSVAMVTLTMRHSRADPLDALWDALADAWSAARGENGTARRALKQAGSLGLVRRVEATHGANGWHLHVHALAFLDGEQPADVQALGDAMFRAWQAGIARHASRAAAEDPQAPAARLGVPDQEHGVQAQVLQLEEAHEAVGQYLAKGLYGAGDGAAELTSSVKRAAGENRTPFQVLSDLLDYGEERDLAIWHEWERASKGRRALTWPVGLRTALGLDQEEASDEELADEGDASAAEAIVTLDEFGWRDVTTTPELFSALMNTVESAPDRSTAIAAVMDLLRAHGVRGAWPGMSRPRKGPSPNRRHGSRRRKRRP
jgi:hypothetical protein